MISFRMERRILYATYTASADAVGRAAQETVSDAHEQAQWAAKTPIEGRASGTTGGPRSPGVGGEQKEEARDPH